jgi:hypothetical protein
LLVTRRPSGPPREPIRAGSGLREAGRFEGDAVGIGEVDGVDASVFDDVGGFAVGLGEPSPQVVERGLVGKVECQVVELRCPRVGHAGRLGEGLDGRVGVLEEGDGAVRTELEEVLWSVTVMAGLLSGWAGGPPPARGWRSTRWRVRWRRGTRQLSGFKRRCQRSRTGSHRRSAQCTATARPRRRALPEAGGAVEAVAGVAEAGEDVAPLIEPLVDRGQHRVEEPGRSPAQVRRDGVAIAADRQGFFVALGAGFDGQQNPKAPGLTPEGGGSGIRAADR